MKAEDIVDLETFASWLKEREPSQEACVWLASRAALRVLPIAWGWNGPTEKVDSTRLSVLRCLSLSDVAANGLTFGKFWHAATAAGASAKAGSDAVALANEFGTDFAIKAAVNATYFDTTAGAKASAAKTASAAGNAASFADADLFAGGSIFAVDTEISTDCAAIEAGEVELHAPLWRAGASPFQERWDAIAQAERNRAVTTSDEAARGGAGLDWRYFVDWYEDVLAGKPRNIELQTEIALEVDWDKPPAEVLAQIEGIAAKYKRGTQLSEAGMADFSFSSIRDMMEAVGFDQDTERLRDPETVQRFLDEIESLQDNLVNFGDFASDVMGPTNAGRVVATANDKLVSELDRTKDETQLRPGNVLILGQLLEDFGNEEAKQAELGPTLTAMLEANLEQLAGICARHFAPDMARMKPLVALELGSEDPKAIISALERALIAMDRADGEDLVPLDPADAANLRVVLERLRDVEANVAEAQSDAYRERQRQKFARQAGGLGATIGRYVEKASKPAKRSGEAIDGLIKQFKRVKSLNDIVEFLSNFSNWGGGA